jgi:hypothetical protein
MASRPQALRDEGRYWLARPAAAWGGRVPRVQPQGTGVARGAGSQRNWEGARQTQGRSPPRQRLPPMPAVALVLNLLKKEPQDTSPRAFKS